MSTGCEFNDGRLVRYAIGRLDPGERAELGGHLAGCEDCRAALAVISTVRAASPAPPPGLEARIRRAARAELRAATGSGAAAPVGGRSGRGARGTGRAGAFAGRWAPWALPLAAAAAVTLWVGIETPWSGGAGEETDVAMVEEFEPYGAWPAAGGVVAGEPVLGDLTVEELERLLEEIQ